MKNWTCKVLLPMCSIYTLMYNLTNHHKTPELGPYLVDYHKILHVYCAFLSLPLCNTLMIICLQSIKMIWKSPLFFPSFFPLFSFFFFQPTMDVLSQIFGCREVIGWKRKLPRYIVPIPDTQTAKIGVPDTPWYIHKIWAPGHLCNLRFHPL